MERKHYTEPIVPGQPPDGTGLVCPRCECRHFRVIYTRPGPHGTIRRRRECRHCQYRLTTVEVVREHSDEGNEADATEPAESIDTV